VAAAKSRGGRYAPEALHRTTSAFDPAMILFNAIVEVPAGAMPDHLSNLLADRAWITVMSIRRHP
jgi:hypothetical protein